MNKKSRRKALSVSLFSERSHVGLALVLVFVLMAFSQSSALITPPFTRPGQHHWGMTDGEDLAMGEERGIAWFVDTVLGNDMNPGTQWGPGWALKTIQQAVNNAGSGTGDYIYVMAGTYNSPNDIPVTVTKSNLHIIGEGAGVVTAFGFFLDHVDHVEITGFTVKTFYMGQMCANNNFMLWDSDHDYIHDNILSSDEPLPTACGFEIVHWSSHNRIEGNVFTYFPARWGLVAWEAPNTMILRNDIQAYLGGVWIQDSDETIVADNQMLIVGVSGSEVLVLLDNENVKIVRNTMTIYGGGDLISDMPDPSKDVEYMWLDNHWSGWNKDVYYGPTDPPLERVEIDDVHIPREGNMAVRLSFDQSKFNVGTDITLRLRDCVYNDLLGFSVYKVGFGQPFPVVEIPVDGGWDQFDVTIEYSQSPTATVLFTIEVMDC